MVKIYFTLKFFDRALKEIDKQVRQIVCSLPTEPNDPYDVYLQCGLYF